jgi:hypothetical protein
MVSQLLVLANANFGQLIATVASMPCNEEDTKCVRTAHVCLVYIYMYIYIYIF